MTNSKANSKAKENVKAKEKAKVNAKANANAKVKAKANAKARRVKAKAKATVNRKKKNKAKAKPEGAGAGEGKGDPVLAVYIFPKDRRVLPGDEEGRAGRSRNRRRLLGGVEDPLEDGQREVLESFLAVIRNTNNYANLSPDELAAFNKVMDEAMLKWALS